MYMDDIKLFSKNEKKEKNGNPNIDSKYIVKL